MDVVNSSSSSPSSLRENMYEFFNCADRGHTYSLWRLHCGPTRYPANKTPVTLDVLEIGFWFAGAILLASFLLIVPGYRGRQRWFFMIRTMTSLFITTSIMIVNFGQEWQVGELETRTPYRAQLREEITARVGVKVGLRSVNITLKAIPEVNTFENGTLEERINYNERFSWDDPGWDLGRAGFGKYAGRFNREYRAHQLSGTPYPILWVAEYFTIDGEGIRWGRYYLQAGYFTHILVWTAFAMWLLTLTLIRLFSAAGGLAAIATGLCLGAASVTFYTIHNPTPLEVPFEDGRLALRYGWCFWLNIATACLCVFIGGLILLVDFINVNALTSFLGKDILQEYEDVYDAPPEISDGLLEVDPGLMTSRTYSRGGDSMFSFTSGDNQPVHHYRRRRLGTNPGSMAFRLGKKPLPLPPRSLFGKPPNPVMNAEEGSTTPAVDVGDRTPLTPPLHQTSVPSVTPGVAERYELSAVKGAAPVDPEKGFHWPVISDQQSDVNPENNELERKKVLDLINRFNVAECHPQSPTSLPSP